MFRFTQEDKSIKAALRRMAEAQFDRMLAAHEGADDPADAVHALRKRTKRVRALIRLVGPAFPDFRAENAALRDAASALSATRDTQALVATFDQYVVADAPGRFAQTRSALVEDCIEAAKGSHGEVEDFLAMITDMRLRACSWTLDATGFPALRKGLGLTYAKARRGMREARSNPSPVAFHEWRKAVKYHAQHLALLRDLAPDILPAQRDLADRLGETLGDHHNLAVLTQTLERHPDRYGRAEARAIIGGIIEKRSAGLEDAAFLVGRQLLAEKPDALVQRLHFYWKHWNKD